MLINPLLSPSLGGILKKLGDTPKTRQREDPLHTLVNVDRPV
jgi:hypothetical protein